MGFCLEDAAARTLTSASLRLAIHHPHASIQLDPTNVFVRILKSEIHTDLQGAHHRTFALQTNTVTAIWPVWMDYVLTHASTVRALAVKVLLAMFETMSLNATAQRDTWETHMTQFWVVSK